MTPGSGMQIIGHRGSAGHAPPSSAPAIEAGLAMGATAIELDVQFAADSTPVVFHDRTLERAAGVNGTIRNQDMRELSGYDVGFRFADRYRGLRLLTLDEAAGLIPEKVDIHIDIKDFDSVNAKHLRGLLGILKQRGGLDRCLFTSMDESILATLGSTDRKVRRGLRTSGARSEAVGRAAALGCASLHPEAASTRRPLIDACRESGLLVMPHSAHDGRLLRNMVDLGVDGVSTGHPDRLAEISKGRRSRRRPERQEGPRSESARSGQAPKPEPAAISRPEAPAAPPVEPEAPELQPAEAVEVAAAVPPDGATEPAEPAPQEASAAKRRRRGRRGGKREQARRARRARTSEAQEPEEEAEVIPLEAVEEETEPVELLGEIHAELDAERAGGEPKPRSSDGRPRRRRGRRGGKRVQARRQRKNQSGNGSDS